MEKEEQPEEDGGKGRRGMEKQIGEGGGGTCSVLTGLVNLMADEIPKQLHLADYIRFSSVCKRWRSKEQRYRGPFRPLPWIIASKVDLDLRLREPTICCSPFENSREYRPPHLSVLSGFTFLASSHGHLLVLGGHDRSLFIFNPITGHRTALPPLSISQEQLNRHNIHRIVAAMSSQTTNFVLINVCSNLYLHRAGDPAAIPVVRPLQPDQFGTTIEFALYFGGKFYGIMGRRLVLVLDPLPAGPVVETIVMNRELPDEPNDASNDKLLDNPCDCSDDELLLDPDYDDSYSRMVDAFLVECNGDMLLVELRLKLRGECCNPGDMVRRLVSLMVFRVDMANRKFVKVTSIGDWVLFLGRFSSFSLPASDLGGKHNCVYYSQTALAGSGYIWTEIDLGTRTPVRVLSPRPNDVPTEPVCWMVPTT